MSDVATIPLDLSGGRGRLEATETLSRDELEALQLERLIWTCRHAYDNVLFYRQRFDEVGLDPNDITSLSDIAALPYTTKDDLRANYPFKMFAVPAERVARIHASSGTTGHPTVVGYTASDLETWAVLVARSLRAAGVLPGMRVHVAYGYGLFTGGLGAHYGAERLGCAVIPASGGMTVRQVQLIEDFRPEVIMVTPSYLLQIADEMERQGFRPRSSSLSVAVLGAEPWTEQMRREIEGRLGLHALDIYGLSEVMGPGVAQECLETKDGLHIWEDHFYPEIIDPVTEEVLAEGASGELVLTSLTREAMPLLRYRTRDRTRLVPGTARPMRRMQRVTGRTDDLIILRGVNLFPTQIEELILEVPSLAPHFQCVISRPNRLDELTVRVEARQGRGGAEERTWAGEELAKLLKQVIGVSIAVDVVEPETIERSLGKATRLVDLRTRS
jgi:phenylacetate-CoA ligase